MASTYQIQLSLDDFKPKIWRRLLVSSETELEDLHKIIQTCMGWDNAHLHQFVTKNREIFSKKMEDDFFFEEDAQTDYKNIKISNLLKKEKDKITYEYDFGDSWYHTVLLEKILPGEIKQPECTKGKNNCPPEDCGGVWGYAEMLETLQKPRSKACKELKEWLGGDFDPTLFDINTVNERLKYDNFGVFDPFF